jgi:hypothetical protein
MRKPAVGLRALPVNFAVEKLSVGGFSAARLAGGCERLVHDTPNGSRAAAALGAATEAMIDLAGRTRGFPVRRQRRTHVMIGEDVAGTDNHRRNSSADNR